MITDSHSRPIVIHLLETLQVGGAEKLAVRLVQHMEKGAYQPIVCCLVSGSLTREITSNGVPVISLNLVRHSMLAFPLFLWDVLKMIVGLARIVQSRNAAIIHAHLPDCAILGGIVGKLLRVKVVATFHGLKMFPFTRHPWAIRNLMRRVFYRLVFSLVDRSIAVSEPVAEMLTQSYGLVAPQMVLIKNGITVDEYKVKSNGSEPPSGLGLSQQSSVVTCVGRLVSNKGQKTLLFAIQEVIKLYPNVKLLLVGDGPLRIELGTLITQLELNDHVSLVGERPDVAEILAVTDIFVLPSFAEGISMALLEAMASGNPVVATNVPGNCDVVVEGETGFLVPWEDSTSLAKGMCRLLADPELAKKLGANGKKRVGEHFSFKKTYSNTMRIYDELLGLV